MTKTSFRILAAATLLSGGAMLVPSDASAAGCCADYARDTTVKSESKEVVTQLTERINAMQLAVVEALRLSAGQATGNSKESIGASSNIANVQDDRQTVRSAEAATLAAVRESAASPSACWIDTASRSYSTLGGAVNKNFASLTQEMADRSLGSHPTSKNGVELARTERLNSHCTKFGTSEDVKSGLCEKAGDYPLADVNVSHSIFYRAPNSDVMGLDDTRVDAANDFMKNSVDPLPMGPMLPGEAGTPEGRAKAAARLAVASRLSVATDAVSDMITRRQRTKNDAQKIQAVAETINGFKGDLSQGYSDMDYMNVMARSFHFSKNNSTIQGMGEAQVLKHISSMMGYQIYQDWRSQQLQEKQTMILAQMLAIMVEQTRPELSGR